MAGSNLDYAIVGMDMASIRRTVAKFFFGAVKRGVRPRPIFIWGPPGVGKTFTMYAAGKDIGKALDRECEVLTQLTSCLEPVDITGIPTPITEQGETVFTRYLPPEWAWRASVEYEQAERERLDDPKWTAPPMLLFFDDLPAAHFQTQTAFFKGVHEGMWGHLTQRDNVMVVGCGNRTEDNAGANEMPTALANRFTHLYAAPTTDDWLEWANGEGGIHPYVIGYIRNNKQNLNVFNVDIANQSEKAFASARSWENVSELLHEGEVSYKGDERIFQSVVMGTIGCGVATEFMAFLKNTNAVVSPEEICKNPNKATIPSTKNLDALHATIASLEHHLKENPKLWEKGIRYAMRKEMVPDFGLILVRTCINILADRPAEEKQKAIASDLFMEVAERYEEAIDAIMGND